MRKVLREMHVSFPAAEVAATVVSVQRPSVRRTRCRRVCGGLVSGRTANRRRALPLIFGPRVLRRALDEVGLPIDLEASGEGG